MNGDDWNLLDTVHPRACGEHTYRIVDDLLSDGSSPRMRGTPISIIQQGKDIRFIPAHAGNTLPVTN